MARRTNKLVAFGTWRCNCTLLVDTIEEIPSRCPTHDAPALGRPSLETNPHGVALGLRGDHRLAAGEVQP